MSDYAERRLCRWKSLLDYFGSDELGEGDACGVCDNCAPEKFARITSVERRLSGLSASEDSSLAR